jgi:hypothetical protein
VVRVAIVRLADVNDKRSELVEDQCNGFTLVLRAGGRIVETRLTSNQVPGARPEARHCDAAVCPRPSSDGQRVRGRHDLDFRVNEWRRKLVVNGDLQRVRGGQIKRQAPSLRTKRDMGRSTSMAHFIDQDPELASWEIRKVGLAARGCVAHAGEVGPVPDDGEHLHARTRERGSSGTVVN